MSSREGSGTQIDNAGAPCQGKNVAATPNVLYGALRTVSYWVENAVKLHFGTTLPFGIYIPNALSQKLTHCVGPKLAQRRDISLGNPLDMNLITNVVLLATAVVGFYTAIVSIRKNEKGKVGGLSVAVEAAIGTLLSVLPVLIFPAALLGFMFLINTYSQYSMSTFRDQDRYAFPDGISETEQMYLLSTHFWNQAQRQDALHMVIDKALEVRDYEVVLRAAKDLIPTHHTDDVLLRAIRQMRGPRELPSPVVTD